MSEEKVLKCNAKGCKGILNIHRMIFITATKGRLSCPICGKNVFIRKTRPVAGMIRDEKGTLRRQKPKNKLSKKERKSLRKKDKA